MLSSITPLGERGRSNRWGLTVASYIAGSTIGGALLGGALGGLGSLLPRAPRVALAVLSLAAVAGLVLELGAAGSHLPSNHRQVSERWLDEYRGWVYGFGFGFQLGAGVVTIVTSAATYLTFIAAFTSHSLLGGTLIGATFGLVRALPVLLTRPVENPIALRTLLRRNARLAPVARRLALGGQMVALGAALLAMMVIS